MDEQAGKALKVSIYVSEGSRHHGADAAASILDFLLYKGVAGATVLKGVAGFGGGHHLHAASTVEISDHLPVKIEFIESREKAEQLLPVLAQMCGSGMIEMQETTIFKSAHTTPQPVQPPVRKVEGKAKLLQIYIDERDQWRGKPLHQALVEALRANHMAGVTVYRAILGYGMHGEVHERGLLSHDASLMVSVIDTEERVRIFLGIVESMIGNGVAAISDVEVIRYGGPAGQ